MRLCSSPSCFSPDGERPIALADKPPEPQGQGVSSWPGTDEPDPGEANPEVAQAVVME
jgi:hypothetical protein